MRWEGDATFAPVLLEGWDVSDDALTYTLFVRRGVTWNNGDVFDAVDVVHNLVRWCDSHAPGNSMASRMAALIDPETGKAADGAIERVDDYTVRLNLLQPDITLIAGMADYPAAISHPDTSVDSIDSPIGTGPFVVTDFRPNDVIQMEANPNYRDPAKPAFATLTFKGGGDATAAGRAVLETGEFDYASNLQLAPDVLAQMAEGGKGTPISAFGTLVEITDRQQTFLPLFRALPPEKRRELKHRLMREDRPFTDWPEALGVEVDPYILLDVLNRNLGELLSIRMRPHMAEAWTVLRSNGVRIGVCSNLSSDYVQSLQSALPDAPDLAVLSCKVGAIKPEPAIYAKVLDGLCVAPDRVLFVGDTPRADIEGPRAAGMRAIHVDELVAVMFPD